METAAFWVAVLATLAAGVSAVYAGRADARSKTANETAERARREANAGRQEPIRQEARAAMAAARDLLDSAAPSPNSPVDHFKVDPRHAIDTLLQQYDCLNRLSPQFSDPPESAAVKAAALALYNVRDKWIENRSITEGGVPAYTASSNEWIDRRTKALKAIREAEAVLADGSAARPRKQDVNGASGSA